MGKQMIPTAKISLNDYAALSFVLSATSIKDLLHYAMVGLSQEDTTHAQDRANICSQAISTFLD